MAKQPNTITLSDFEFNIHGYEFVADVHCIINERTENLEVDDLDFEGKEMFDVQYIIEYLENELDEELYEVYSKGLERYEDGLSEYRASLRD